jgi:3-hydroxyisobutyrate dehydrogenase
MKIGFLGLGKMGFPMASRLVSNGFEVIVYNRSINKSMEFSKKWKNEFVTLPKELVNKSDILIIMVSDDDAVKNIVTGSDGIISELSSKNIVINMSTVTPLINVEMQKTFNQLRVPFLEAPVIGSVPQAEKGELVIIVGGDYEIYKRVEHVLKVLGKEHVYVGDIPKASMTKLLVNSIFLGTSAVLAEVLAASKALGIFDAVINTTKKSRYSVLLDLFLDRFEDPNAVTRFGIDLATKDLGYASMLLNMNKLSSHMTSQTYNLFLEALTNGLRSRDYTKIYDYLVSKNSKHVQ